MPHSSNEMYHFDRWQFLRTVSFVLLLAAWSRTSLAISLHLLNDFQDGTTQGWSGSPTVNVPDAGPLGMGDNALEVQSDFSGGQRTVTFNGMAEWKGNFLEAGVTRIRLQAQHSNTFPLELRLGIAGPLGVGPMGRGDTYVTNYSLNVPGDGAWHELEFRVTPMDFDKTISNTNPSADIWAALSDATQLRILHNPEPRDFRGAQDGGTWRLDNVRTIPEPATGALMKVSGALLLLSRRNARRAFFATQPDSLAATTEERSCPHRQGGNSCRMRF